MLLKLSLYNVALKVNFIELIPGVAHWMLVILRCWCRKYFH